MSQMVYGEVTEASLGDAQSLATKTREDLNWALDAGLEIVKQINLAKSLGLHYGHLLTEHAKLTRRIKKLEAALANANKKIVQLNPLRGPR